ncbi:ribonuclease Y [mine drainage metagenome]|uniref:Ribonuclease Y n=1 Tax=mine drainage metagenome TaxID=410659 RepID=A0A1J5RCT7_9ZZZZ
MNGVSLEEILSRVSTLPTLPEAARYVIATIDDETANADSLVDRLNTDPIVVARILAAANSSAFALRSRIDSMRQAILVLGLKEIRTITLATAVIDRLNLGSGAFDPRILWRHSLGVAVCARAIAEDLRYNPEAAFTAGLLHDIGQMLLFAAAPELFEEALRRCRELDEPIVESEQAVFGFDHAVVGAELVRHWRLPTEIADGIGGHHDPEGGHFGEMGDLIHVAEVLSHALDLGKLPDNRVPAVSSLACARLGIDWADFSPRMADIEAAYDEILLALNLH